MENTEITTWQYTTQSASDSQANKKKKENKPKEQLTKIMFYGLRFLKEQDSGVIPGHHRPLLDRDEFIASIIYNHSADFRQAIDDLKIRLLDTEISGGKGWSKWGAWRAQNEMQHPTWRPATEPRTRREAIRHICHRIRSMDIGRTYIEYLTHNYGGPIGFANQTNYGMCENCWEDLPVWRRCKYCAAIYLNERGRDIFIICMECPRMQHQIELATTKICGRCYGPPELEFVPSDFE